MILIGQIAGVAGVIPPLQGKPAENLKFPQSLSWTKMWDKDNEIQKYWTNFGNSFEEIQH